MLKRLLPLLLLSFLIGFSLGRISTDYVPANKPLLSKAPPKEDCAIPPDSAIVFCGGTITRQAIDCEAWKKDEKLQK